MNPRIFLYNGESRDAADCGGYTGGYTLRKTKIICTIGPASANEQTLTRMCMEGMNVARMNFSHGDHAEQLGKINLVKKVRQQLNLPIAIMLDTKGPEYRLGCFENKKVSVNTGDTFTFTTRDVLGNQEMVSVSYKKLHKELRIGDTITACNGMVSFRVDKLQDQDIICTVTEGGELADKKSMSFPNKVMHHQYLSKQDQEDILFGIENDVDFVAASFVSTRQDAQELRDFLDRNGGKSIDIIAKIENRAGVDNVDEICQIVDGIMVARGDLGVEIPFVEVPAIQKMLIEKCRLLGKRVITATEMLESMISNPRPTRAEISDVANAVYDGSSAIMLSGETAAGRDPALVVRVMSKIARQAEQDAFELGYGAPARYNSQIDDATGAICDAACTTARDIGASAIIALTKSGYTARCVSKYRPAQPIIAATPEDKTYHQLALSWGVYPVHALYQYEEDAMYRHAIDCAKMSGYIDIDRKSVV